MHNPSANRSMFRRILRRLLFANRGRLFVILLALSAGAAVSAALLNLQVDAKRRLTSEFRAFGPNIVITPRSEKSSGDDANTLAESDFQLVPNIPINQGGKSAALFVLATAVGYGSDRPVPVVVVGSISQGGNAHWNGQADVAAPWSISRTEQNCSVGDRVAAALHVTTGDRIVLRNQDREESCHVWLLWEKGSSADDKILVNLSVAQQLANLPKRISLIEVGVPGAPKEIEQFAQQLQQKFPDAEVRPLRQFSEAQAKIYSRISGLLTAATALILALTALCVMAAMTNIAAERRNDVGMMKAIGGSARRVLNLFLTEAVILGLVGGLFGAGAGIALSMALGKAVFGVAAAPRLIVYPISVALTVIVAILGAYPLRRLVNVRPATIFRGDA